MFLGHKLPQPDVSESSIEFSFYIKRVTTFLAPQVCSLLDMFQFARKFRTALQNIARKGRIILISTPLHIRQIQSIRFILVFFGLAPVAGMNNLRSRLQQRQ